MKIEKNEFHIMNLRKRVIVYLKAWDVRLVVLI